MLNYKVIFDFSIMKKLWDLAHDNLVIIQGGHDDSYCYLLAAVVLDKPDQDPDNYEMNM